MKTFDKKDVYSWSNAEDAKEYLGKDCYFAHSVGGLSEHIKTGVMGILKDIFNSNYDAVSCAFGDGTSTWGLCLPADKVKEVEEKKWRAFEDLNEFTIWTDKTVGSVITFRRKGTTNEFDALITKSAPKCDFIVLGVYSYLFEELFEKYEWLNPRNEWQPFGVEV